MVLNSVCHLNGAQVEELNLGLEETVDTYLLGQQLKLTDEWKQYTVEFDITETYINEIYAYLVVFFICYLRKCKSLMINAICFTISRCKTFRTRC